MTAIEILAAIFAVMILVKLVMIMINPKAWLGLALGMLKMRAEVTALYVVLAVIIGYFIFTSLSIVQVAAVILFASILFGLGFMPYSEVMLDIVKQIPTDRAEIFRKNWLSIIIWVILAVWTLYAVFGKAC